MKKYYFTIIIIFIVSNIIYAHLCDDVFTLAKKILAVKVDVRDGQLRINDKGSFRVYVLNTMDADLTEIRLNVLSDEFDSTVKPSDEWTNYPKLTTVHKSGKKEFFEVILKRKSEVKSGIYNIKIELTGRQSFITLDIKEATYIYDVPKTNNIIIDGNINENEWGNGLLCGNMKQIVGRLWFNQYGSQANYEEKIISNLQSRFRFSHDEKNLYCLADFQKLTKNDIAIIYISSDEQTSPVIVKINTTKKSVECSNGNTDIEYKFNNEKVELKIPIELLKLKNKNFCFVDIERSNKSVKTYWVGDIYTINDPVFYARLNLK